MKPGRKFGKKNEPNEKKQKIPKDKKTDAKLQDKLLELEDSEIEALFEAGRITQDEYEYILDFRKKQKTRKKSQKEQFEERIRCDNTIISKIVNLGRRFRVEDLLAHGKFEEAKRADINKEFLNEINEIEEQEYSIDDRVRDKQREERLKEKYLDRNSKGRGKERDSR